MTGVMNAGQVTRMGLAPGELVRGVSPSAAFAALSRFPKDIVLVEPEPALDKDGSPCILIVTRMPENERWPHLFRAYGAKVRVLSTGVGTNHDDYGAPYPDVAVVVASPRDVAAVLLPIRVLLLLPGEGAPPDNNFDAVVAIGEYEGATVNVVSEIEAVQEVLRVARQACDTFQRRLP